MNHELKAYHNLSSSSSLHLPSAYASSPLLFIYKA